jgi:hypothetical protein
MTRVELDMRRLSVTTRDEAVLQFVVRRQLGDAGIPIGPWGSSAPARGVLSWHDDWEHGVRIVEWQEGQA